VPPSEGAGGHLRGNAREIYLKIDIEHADRYCLDPLKRHRLPKYVSIEAHELEDLLILWVLGYRHFKVIDQMRHNSTFPLLSNKNAFSRIGKLVFWYGRQDQEQAGQHPLCPGIERSFRRGDARRVAAGG
jgi:hypothetical protein